MKTNAAGEIICEYQRLNCAAEVVWIVKVTRTKCHHEFNEDAQPPYCYCLEHFRDRMAKFLRDGLITCSQCDAVYELDEFIAGIEQV